MFGWQSLADAVAAFDRENTRESKLQQARRAEMRAFDLRFEAECAKQDAMRAREYNQNCANCAHALSNDPKCGLCVGPTAVQSQWTPITFTQPKKD